MEEKIIEKEKANFLMKNKDALINNFSSINYMLFNLLISSESLKNIEEYKQILDVINNNNNIQKKQYVEASEIIYYLSSILNKLCINNKEQSSYRTKLYSYLTYFKERQQEKLLVKRKISA